MDIKVENFEKEVIESEVPVLVDFWASWCGPCKMMTPVMEEIAEELGDNVKVCKVNIDEERSLALKFNVMSIPTFLIFKNGEIVDTKIGVQDKSVLVEALQK